MGVWHNFLHWLHEHVLLIFFSGQGQDLAQDPEVHAHGDILGQDQEDVLPPAPDIDQGRGEVAGVAPQGAVLEVGVTAEAEVRIEKLMNETGAWVNHQVEVLQGRGHNHQMILTLIKAIKSWETMKQCIWNQLNLPQIIAI